MDVLIDTSFLAATFFAKDKFYRKALDAKESLKKVNRLIVPAPVVHELFFMVTALT